MAAITPLLDTPFFELCNQVPTASGATSCTTTSEDGSDQFIYYVTGTTAPTFFRFNTLMDTWQQLASPPLTLSTYTRMRYTKRRGTHGRVISAGASTVRIPGLRNGILNGATIRIEYGTGAGQERTLTYVGETIHDAGVITGPATVTTNFSDSTKKWRVNQWAGYTVAISFNTGVTNYKKILYNDATTLTIADANLQPHDPWNNQAYGAFAPYAAPISTAGATQSSYIIMSQDFTVNTPWTTVPDETSYFTTLTGGIYLLTSAAAAPFYAFAYYDVANDNWQTKNVPRNFLLAAATDGSIERTGLVGTAAIQSTATSGTIRTLTDSTLTLTNDRYSNYRLFITGGTGVGQNRRIVANTATTFTVARSWTTTPDATSTFQVWPDSDRVYASFGGQATLLAYSPENDYWMQGQAFDDSVIANITATMNGWVPVGVTSGAIIAAGVTALNPVPVAGGTSGYAIGDVLTLVQGAFNTAQAIVTGITSAGVVTSVALTNCGTVTGYAVGNATHTATGSQSGNVTIAITAVGQTATITTASAHWYRTGNSITFAGCTEAAWNAAYTILGAPATNTFCVAAPGVVANMVAAASSTTTLIVDPSKAWITNEHVGRIVQTAPSGQAPATTDYAWITANTATSLTLASAVTLPVNGTTRYVIYDAKVFGVDVQRQQTGQESYGYATGGTTTTLVDAARSWVPGQWTGYAFKIEAGTGYGSGRIIITGNTENTLTFAVQAFSPDATTKYEIADCWGLATAAGTTTTIVEGGSTKNFTTNQFQGKRIRITAFTGIGQESTISATSTTTGTTTITFTAVTTAPAANSAYAILSTPLRGAGFDLVWGWGGTDAAKRGKLIYSPRGGGSNTLDIFDINTARFIYGIMVDPQGEGFTTGSSYTYDGADTVFLSRSTTGTVNRIIAFDVNTYRTRGYATTTIVQGTATVGNFLDVVNIGGYEFLYNMQTSGTLFSRALVF